MEPAIVTRGLTRTFDGIVAVDHLDLEVPQGIVFGFLGPNGAGKTTTIRLLLGLLEPTSGSAKVLGFDLSQSHRIRERVGVVLEQPGLYPRMSAWENMEFFAAAYKIPPHLREKRITELLQHLGLWERRHDPVATFSKGMTQKLAFARSLLHNPSLIFMDEPTTGLDVPGAAALREDIAELVRETNATIFLSTHNMTEVEKMCDLVGVINEGRLLTVGSPEDLRTRASQPRLRIAGRKFNTRAIESIRKLPGVTEVTSNGNELYVTMEEGAGAHAVIRTLTEQGAEIDEVTRVASGLEDAFLAILREDQEGRKDSAGKRD